MIEQWTAIIVTCLIAAVSIITNIYQSSQAKTAAASAEKVRADISTLMITIIDRIDQKLDDYVRSQNLKDYVEGHAKEHVRIEQELTRLRDWKEDMDSIIRRNDIKLDEFSRGVDELRRTLERKG